MGSYYTYIAANKYNSVIYTGITNNIARRMDEHTRKVVPGLTSKYNVSKLLWFEEFETPDEAIAAEKRIKGWTLKKKIALIKDRNPRFTDLLHGDPSTSSQDDEIEQTI